MTSIEDRPTIGERYSSATESSNLKFDTQKRGDVDLLIAAGAIKDGLGAKLFRLCVEFDKADLRAIKPGKPEPIPDRIQRLAKDRPEEFKAQAALWHQVETARLAKEHAAAVTTAKALAMVHMRTLPAAREELGRYAVVMATKQRFMRPDAEVLKLVGRVLDVFLDPNCHHCEGRGANGGGRHEHAGPQIICRACKGTGQRAAELGRHDDERRFAADLLADMQSRMTDVESAMQRFIWG